MFYFILWAVFLLAVVLAVPITAWWEKRKLAVPASEQPETDEPVEEAAAEPGLDDEFSDDPLAGQEVTSEVPGGEDFSAFDEEFK